MSAYITILGAPGSGKGTQCRRLGKALNIPVVGIGDTVRGQVKNKTQIGLEAIPFIEKGELVPDDIIIKMFQNKIDESMMANGVILDGFPRNYEQAIAFDSVFKKGSIDTKVFSLDVSQEAVMERLLGRLLCSKCGEIYHKTLNPPQKDMFCNLCNHMLIKRSDDNEMIIKNRHQVYEKTIRSVCEYFGKRVIRISGEEKAEHILKKILNKVEMKECFDI